MYFEPVKKTYYRFPSANSVQNYDAKHYYPEQPYASGENNHYNSKVLHPDQGRYLPGSLTKPEYE